MQGRTGFTLIELLIVLATVALLAAIAYPSYASYTIKARRTEGQIALIEALQQQERFYTSRNTYVAFSSASAEPQAQRFKWWSGSSAATSAYELQAQACPGKDLAQCVELRATPGSARVDAAFKDAECQTLILNSVGERSASGAHARCWP